MKARWIYERRSPQLPIVGQAVVAGFWPWKHYFVSTGQRDTSTPTYKLLQSLKVEPLEYVTLISRCNRMGIVKDFSAIFEKEYKTLVEAKNGHVEVLELLAKGLLKFNQNK